MDAGDYDCVHPSKKRETGYRLAYLALYNDYVLNFINPNPPIYKGYEYKGNEIIISFDIYSMGLSPFGHEIEGFEIASNEGVFISARARISDIGLHIRVSRERIKRPVAKRYCFRNASMENLYNCFGMPVGLFRTND